MTFDQEALLEKVSWFELGPNWKSTIYGRAAQWAYNPVRHFRSLLSTKSWRRSGTLRPTAYLDGLRGFAALLVYILHNQVWAHDSLKSDKIFENGFGYDRQFYFATLPGIRTFFSGGHFAVAVFFVISGYVLSHKPLRLIHDGELVKLGDNLASAFFRRWLRLYLPVIATTFVWMTLNYLIRGLTINKAEPRYLDEFTLWYNELKGFSFIFRLGGEPWFTYNFHVWTIPLEFKGSIVVFTSLLAFSRCTRNTRLWCQLGLVYYFLYIVDGWYCSLFVAGMLLCDLDLLAQSDNLPDFFNLFQPHKDSILIGMFVVGLYLGGVPAFSPDLQVLRDSPGWYYLSFLKPQAVFMVKSFYLFWAGIFMVVASGRISWLRGFFELPFNQYLGRVSYAFYLVHGPVLWCIGDRVYAAVGWTRAAHAINISSWANVARLPNFGPLGLEFNFLAAQLILLPLTLWFAKVVTVLIDDPTIQFSRWLYTKATKPATSPLRPITGLSA
ncbi:hypothetical protein BT63DRAFT_371835 [Microthyrium microscopicum]|uniref:Acyltransferase 3 domain-containing protein n=1 Tax=Microthyrium microscopicum TaxID=703497 RepID=A0A6A6UF02_9PEZI|nr:hypothetical protein BT63DRAFT_371835 [Microthyrium microscopicum]